MKKKLLFTLLGFLILNLIIYHQSLGNLFVSDDYDLLNVAVNGAGDWHDYLTGNYYGEHGVGGSLRPMVIYMLNAQHFFFGLNPTYYHLISILFNSINAFLVFLLTALLLKDNSKRWLIGGIAGLIFTALPFHTEAVAWVAAQGDLLATSFYLASLLFFIYATNIKNQITNNKQIPNPKENQKFKIKNQNWKIILSLLFFIAGLLTKEIVLTLPSVLTVLVFLQPETYNLKSISYKLRSVIGYWILGIGYLIYRMWAIDLLFGYYGETHLQIRVWDYLLTASNLFWNIFVFGSWRGIVGNSIVGVIVFCGFLVFSFFHLWKNKRNTELFIVSFWLINIVLILPLTLHPYTNEGERYGYLSSVAVAILLTLFLFYLWGKNKIITVVVSAFLLVYFSTVQVLRQEEWRLAGEITKAIISQLKTFDYQSYKKTFILGLPQSYHGAPIMRNGVSQFLALNNIPGNVERIPVYLKDGINFSGKLYDNIEERGDGILAHSNGNNFIFDGNATENHPEYKFELWGYDYGTNLAPNIRLQFQGGREFDWARREIQILYWNNGRIEAVNL